MSQPPSYSSGLNKSQGQPHPQNMQPNPQQGFAPQGFRPQGFAPQGPPAPQGYGYPGQQGPPGTVMGPAGYPVPATVSFGSFPSQAIPIMSDPDKIKEMGAPCMAQCPHCRYTGLTMVVTRYNTFLLILGLLTIFSIIGIFIIMFWAPERTHVCTRCDGEVARKKKCCC